MDKTFIMLSGIPRSGSQVLVSALNQNKYIHASTTSPVVDLLTIIDDNWYNISRALVAHDANQYSNIVSGVIDGAYQHIQKPIIIDKNRLWPRYSNVMSNVLGHPPKIICTVRNISEVVASYILLIEKNNNIISFVDQDLIDMNVEITTQNRCQRLINHYIKHPYDSLAMTVNSNIDTCFVDYNDIVGNTQQTINKICNFIGIHPHTVDTQNLQSMDENDEFHGGLTGLHHVRPIMKRVSPPPEQVIGKDLTDQINNMQLEFWKNKIH